MNQKQALLRARSEIREAIIYLNDHEIIRGYRAVKRASKEIDNAIALAEAEE